MNHKIFQRLHRRLREMRSFHVTRHDAGRRRVVRSLSLEESILNGVADRPESRTRTDVHHRVQALNPAGYHLRLRVGSTAMGTATGLHSSCSEHL
ncbi:uncharacterized protein TNCV_1404371 [Trichonephila clavipes]|nr:uncharacterized protein TNCV_1404371 [Trichonephila clavipes]